jgi:cyclophilin family peptidyl-prolyl cis-trans isomerase
MIQGGDYENRNGTGGKAFVGGEIKDEFVSGLSNVRGAISMANRGPNTNGSQFFIVHKDAKFLDGKHSVFGRITSGMEVLDAIANTPKNMQDKPLEDVIIASVTVSE